MDEDNDKLQDSFDNMKNIPSDYPRGDFVGTRLEYISHMKRLKNELRRRQRRNLKLVLLLIVLVILGVTKFYGLW